jgi:hypothetical protein
MSSHYIYVKCKTCGASDTIYTGESDLQYFQNESYNLASVEAICDECEGKDND